MNQDKHHAPEHSLPQKRGNPALRRGDILGLPAEKALKAIIDAPDGLSLVQSFSEEDLFFLIHEIGIADALPVIQMASDIQWEYMLDREIWSDDRISTEGLTRWMGYLMEASPQRLVRWMAGEKVELLEYYLMKNIEVHVRVHDQDPSELGDDCMTHDDVYYTRIRDYPFDPPLEKEVREQRNDLVKALLDLLAETDFMAYQKILLETPTVLPAEMEEELYRLRNVRLAEKGFVPAEEAIGIYQPLSVADLKHGGEKRLADESGYESSAPTPLMHARVMKSGHLFSQAFGAIHSESTLLQLQAEFAGLCNRIIAADRRPVREREELKDVVLKVCGYVRIGLESVSVSTGRGLTAETAAEWIRSWPLEKLFRIGSGGILEIKRRAEKWLAGSWMRMNRLSIRFWDERNAGYLGGILLKQPMFFDNYRTGTIYRDFQSMADLQETTAVINEVMAYDRILNDLGIPVKPLDDGFLTFKNFFLTLWARDSRGLSVEPTPMPLNEFAEFLRRIFHPEKTGKGLIIGPETRHSFLTWLAGRTGRDEADISIDLGSPLDTLFNQIETELGRVSLNTLDPKFIQLFLVEKKSGEEG